jgi:hypothetical protein
VNPQAALERLQSAEVRRVPLDALQTDEALQPRELRMVPFRFQTGVQARSEEHAGTMRLALEANASVDLEPLLVAEIDGGLFIVDGHHRLKAYRLARKDAVPCRAVPMRRAEAVMVSKLVNCSSRALEMHPEQRRDAAWQYLAGLTRQGADGLPAGESTRSIGGRFGISHTTVATMLRTLPKVNPKEWDTSAHDPGTGFPRWRYVRENRGGWQGMESKMTPEQLTQREAEKGARKIGAILEGMTAEARRRALEMLANEAKLEANNADTLAFLADIGEPEAGGY